MIASRKLRGLRNWLKSTAALVCGVALAGCGSSAPQMGPLFPVSGCVKLDGQPLVSAAVRFVPRDDTKGTGAFGATDQNGHYELIKSSAAVGLEAGSYTVMFSKVALPNGDPIPEGKTATDVGARETLPRHLTMPTEKSAVYSANVKDGGDNIFDFDLKGSRKKNSR